MVYIITENAFLISIVLFPFTLFIFVLMIINYRKRKCCEIFIASLIGSDEAIYEYCKQAAKLDKQEVKARIMGLGEKDQVAEGVKLVKALDTLVARKAAAKLRMNEKRLESIVKLANINRSQILDELSKIK